MDFDYVVMPAIILAVGDSGYVVECSPDAFAFRKASPHVEESYRTTSFYRSSLF